jgi:Aminotransferase class-III
VTSTGHCHPAVVAAAQEQVARLIHGQYTTVLSTPLRELARRMGEVLPGHLDRLFFVNSGSETGPASRHRASAMGNAIEWYDYGIYAYLVTAVGANFFPAHDPAAQTLSAPTQIRYAGLAISYNVSTALFGGTAPFVNDYMIPRTSAYWPAFYMMAAAVIGLIALRFAPETAGASMRGTHVPHLAAPGSATA